MHLPIGFHYLSLTVLTGILDVCPKKEDQMLMCEEIGKPVFGSVLEKILKGSGTASILSGTKKMSSIWNLVEMYLKNVFPTVENLDTILPMFYDRNKNVFENILSIMQSPMFKVFTLEPEYDTEEEDAYDLGRSIVKGLNEFEDDESFCVFYIRTPEYGAPIVNGCRPILKGVPDRVEDKLHKDLPQWQLTWMIVSYKHEGTWISCLVYISGQTITIIGDNFGKEVEAEDNVEATLAEITENCYVHIAAYNRQLAYLVVKTCDSLDPYHTSIDNRVGDDVLLSICDKISPNMDNMSIKDFIIDSICCPYRFMLDCGLTKNEAKAAVMCLEQHQSTMDNALWTFPGTTKERILLGINCYENMTNWVRHLIGILYNGDVMNFCSLLACVVYHNPKVVTATGKICHIMLKMEEGNNDMKSYLAMVFGEKTQEYFGYEIPVSSPNQNMYRSMFVATELFPETLPIHNLVMMIEDLQEELTDTVGGEERFELCAEYRSFLSQAIMGSAVVP